MARELTAAQRGVPSTYKYSACLIAGLGRDLGRSLGAAPHDANDVQTPFASEGAVCRAMRTFVQHGGVLVLNGDRAAAASLSAWFGLRWCMPGDDEVGYQRLELRLADAADVGKVLRRKAGAGALAGLLPAHMSVKACLLQGVPRASQLYADGGEKGAGGLCAVAAATYGKGERASLAIDLARV